MKQVIDKEYVKNVDSEAQKDIEEAENLAEIVGAMIRQRNSLGISQRELAAMCNMPQSSVARIESMKTTPNLDTLLKLFEPLGLALTVSMKTFKGYTQEDMTLIANHINSTTRPGLGYKSPYELVETEEMKKLLEVLNMSQVPADEICLSPKLLSKE